jgi:hypothetical protein
MDARRIRVLLLGGALAALSACAQAPAPSPAQSLAPAPTSASIQAFEVPVLEAMGRVMHQQDLRAAAATDTLLAQKLDLARENMRGWIVDASPTVERIRFIRERDGALEAAYDILFQRGSPPSFTVPQDRKLEPREIAQIMARRLALQRIERPCSDRYNTIAIPDADGSWLVWAIAATTKPDAILIGGHHRFMISKDGQTVLRHDALSRSCIAIEKSATAPDRTPVAAVATHIVSETPIETHVFLSLLHRTPLYVGVPDRSVWLVQEGQMRKLKPGEGPGAR